MLKEHESKLRIHRELWFEFIPHSTVEKWAVYKAGEEVAKVKITFDGGIKVDFKPYKEGNERVYEVSNRDVSWLVRSFTTDKKRDKWMDYVAIVINETLHKINMQHLKSQHTGVR